MKDQALSFLKNLYKTPMGKTITLAVLDEGLRLLTDIKRKVNGSHTNRIK